MKLNDLFLPFRLHRLPPPLFAFILVLLLLSIAANSFNQHNDRVVVDINEELTSVNPLLFGQNYGPWMETSQEYVDLYKQARVTLLRFPAGEWGDENDITRAQLDELAALAQDLDAEVSVQARLFPNSTPEQAAELVRYANIEKSYDFKIWEIGNEPDLYHERSNPQNSNFTPEWYSQRYREYYAAMKAVDSSILIAGPVVTIGWEEWMPTFIYLNGDIIDVLSWHWYGHGDELEAEEVLTRVNQIEHQIETIRFWWKDPVTNPNGYERPIPRLFVSEYGVSSASTIYEQLGTQTAALWAAEVIGRMMNSGVDMAAHFALQGTHWHGLIDDIDESQHRPVYGLFELYNRWGSVQVAAESLDEWTLPAFASKEGNSLMVMVINQIPDTTREVEVVVQGARLSGTVHGWRLSEEGDLIELPEEAAGSSYTTNLPPYTITLLSFDIAPESRIIRNAIILLIVVFAVLILFAVRQRGRV